MVAAILEFVMTYKLISFLLAVIFFCRIARMVIRGLSKPREISHPAPRTWSAVRTH